MLQWTGMEVGVILVGGEPSLPFLLVEKQVVLVPEIEYIANLYSARSLTKHHQTRELTKVKQQTKKNEYIFFLYAPNT